MGVSSIPNNDMSTIYVLRLKGGKYYIGKTDKDVEVRFQEHVRGNGSAWTRQFQPINIIEHRKMVSVLDEDTVTKEYMLNYGIENVRGGSYVQLQLDGYQMDALLSEFRMATDA